MASDPRKVRTIPRNANEPAVQPHERAQPTTPLCSIIASPSPPVPPDMPISEPAFLRRGQTALVRCERGHLALSGFALRGQRACGGGCHRARRAGVVKCGVSRNAGVQARERHVQYRRKPRRLLRDVVTMTTSPAPHDATYSGHMGSADRCLAMLCRQLDRALQGGRENESDRQMRAFRAKQDDDRCGGCVPQLL